MSGRFVRAAAALLALAGIGAPAFAQADFAARGLAVQAKARALAASDGYFPVGCRGSAPYQRGVGSSVYTTARTRHVLPHGATDIVLAYGGFKLVPAEQSTTMPTMEVGIEPTWGATAAWGAAGSGASVIRRVTANAALDMTVPTDGLLLTDPVSINASAETAIGIRELVATGSGAIVTRNASGVGGLGEYAIQSSSVSYPAWGGSQGSGATSPALVPIAILGRTPDRIRYPSVAIIGDSIDYGTTSVSGGGNSYDTLDADGNAGWEERALSPGGVCKVPFSNFGNPGDRLQYWMTSAVAGRRYSRLLALKKLGFTHVILKLGTNDAGGAGLTAAQIEDLWINLMAELTGSGFKVIAVTPPPIVASSSDAFATVANQAAGNTAIRDFSNWLVANAKTYGADRVIDLNGFLRDGTDTTKWSVSLNATLGAPPTYDGTHFSQAMTAYLGSVGLLTPAMLTYP